MNVLGDVLSMSSVFHLEGFSLVLVGFLFPPAAPDFSPVQFMTT